MYVSLVSHFAQISSIISLSDPPDIEHTIFLYLLLFIFDHALIKLSPIISFLGQFSNSPIKVFSPNMYFPHVIDLRLREVKPYFIHE